MSDLKAATEPSQEILDLAKSIGVTPDQLPDVGAPSEVKPEPRSMVKSPRRRARELALQSLYHWLVNPDDLGVIQVDVITKEAPKRYDKGFYTALFEGVVAEMPRLRDALVPFLDRPQVEVSPVEHAILLAGAYELIHFPETPFRVIINESIELAKSFGGTDGHKYVNGVLDKLAAQVRPHG
jgi:transcription antitermination protein NusB